MAMIEHVVVSATGGDQHMGSLTRTRPKAMLPIMGRPLIVRLMDRFYDAGIRRYTVVVGEQEGEVVSWLSSKWHVDVQVDFAPQGFELGTGAALLAASNTIDGPFILAASDNLISREHARDLAAYFERRANDIAGLSVIDAPQEIGLSAPVILDPMGYAMYIGEKPGEGYQADTAAISIYAFSAEAMNYLDRMPRSGAGEREVSTLMMAMIDDGQQVGHIKADVRHHISTPEDLLRANMHYLSEGRDAHILSDLSKDVFLIEPVRVDPRVTIGQGSIIGPNVYLESGTVVGQDVRIENAVILGRTISTGQTIFNEIVNEQR